ncbi:uncharacterized protein LOC106511791 [Austrofundulus limnaeus]|uniref:HECT-type E3 ubiquitin transferase n=1 Tax=Austrofundulus limnaeus TaxID=52670 RepID=A0A2I4AKH3_AUSLI|nr:PREDICTED: uncharacterized protein LOC106511791 [Austrofundulus limnaeus]
MADGNTSKDRIGQAAAILNSILSSPDATSSVTCALNEGPPVTARSDSVETELASLFRAGAASRSSAVTPGNQGPSLAGPSTPRFQAQQCFGPWSTSKRRRPKGIQYHESFNKEVILLPDSTWEVICKPPFKQYLHENGHILSAFEFHKSWDYHTVIQQIRNGFGSTIPQNVSLQIVMGCGNKLIAPKLQDGQQLNGQLIQRVFRSKALYVRPSQTLLEDPEERSTTTYQVSPRTTRAMARSKQFSTIENPIVHSNELESFHQGVNYSSFCSHDTIEANIPPYFQTSSQSSASVHPNSISTSTSATNFNPSSTSEVCQDETTAHASANYSTYLSVMSNVSDLSSEDEEMNHAILASIETHLSETSSKTLHVKDILEDLSKKIDNGMNCKFNVNRSAVLDGAIRGFKRVTYNPHFSMNVKFSDDFGRNEEAVDLGGPRREFLRLLIDALSISPMFEGPDDCKNLAMNSTALREDKYFMAGRAIAVSLVHGGPAPRFLSPVLFSCLVGGPNAACPTLKDITDAELHEKLKKVSESLTVEELQRATDPLFDYMASAGCIRRLTTIRDRDLLLHDLLMFHVVHRVQGPFQRFEEGLKTLGVLDAVKQHPDSFQSLFCYEPQQLTADMVDDLFTPRLAPEGSNRRRVEEAVIPLWRDYLQDAEDEGSSKLENILVFATGAKEIPPIGFSPAPSIEFLHESSEECSSKRMLPMANTCVNCLKLPIITSYEVFKENMDYALGNTQGFGRL